jgi:hypothetical protein
MQTNHKKLEIEIDDFWKKFQEKQKKEIFAITEKWWKRNSKKDYYHSVKCHTWLVLQQ